MNIIQTLCQVIGERDSYTVEHSRNVACLMAGFAEYAELPVEDVTLAYLAGIVHDVGKVNLPDHILNKQGRLTAEERAIIKQHPDIGASILAEVDGLAKVAETVLYHHERYDGQGYGTGLSGDEIPLFSRMLTLCDSFDAMTTARCYRRTPLSKAKALEEIANCAGTQFDPAIAKCFIEYISCRQRYDKLATANA